jgi:hypothetical protein
MRQNHITNNQVVIPVSGHLQSFCSIVGSINGKSVFLQTLSDGIRRFYFIFNYEQSIHDFILLQYYGVQSVIAPRERIK